MRSRVWIVGLTVLQLCLFTQVQFFFINLCRLGPNLMEEWIIRNDTYIIFQAANETHYVGAVVEFSPTRGNPSANALRFQEFIEYAKNKSADIIVFPEIGLNGYGPCSEEMLTEVPNPKKKICPCQNKTKGYTDAFIAISCAAQEQNIYVVVNVAEILPCNGNGCPERGYLKYNTNVVFDRSGVVIARYRKYNLFGEVGTNITSLPELVYFETDFGVRFGTFICFDILFEAPTLTLIQECDVKHIVYSTAWFSEMPFLTAVQTQQGFAYAADVTFLGSGYNDPAVGSGGSGIYVGRQGSLARTFPDKVTSEILVAAISKDGKSGSVTHQMGFQPISDIPSSDMFLKKDHLAAYVSAPLEDFKSEQTLCHNDFCCNFTVDAKPPSEEVSYRYLGLVFNGVRTFDGVATGGIQACAIATCGNDSVTSCGERVVPQHLFSSLKIVGKFKAEKAVQIPSTLINDKQLLPLTSDQFSYTSKCDASECLISMLLTQPQNNLLTFGIYGRDFAKDGQPVTPAPSPNSGSTINLQSLIWILVVAVLVTQKKNVYNLK